MNDFVAKPFEPAAVFATIGRHLRGQGGTSPEPLSRHALLAVDDGAGWPLIEGIDTEDARSDLGVVRA
jgi:DNA-binding response OmpR family regulator